MRAVDTNVLVRLVTRDDSRQATSAERFVGKGAWVSVLVLAEATWVLATVYELAPRELAKAIEMLLNHRDLVLQDARCGCRCAGALSRKTSTGLFRLPDPSVGSEGGTSSAGHFAVASRKVEGAQKLFADALALPPMFRPGVSGPNSVHRIVAQISGSIPKPKNTGVYEYRSTTQPVISVNSMPPNPEPMLARP